MIITLDSVLKFLSLLVVAITAFLLNKFFYNRPKLIAYYGHFSGHLLKKCTPHVAVFSHSVVVRNIGKLTATNVKLGHIKQTDPQGKDLEFPEFNVFPEVMYTAHELPSGGKEIIFPTLVPNKQLTISYLYFHANHMNFNTYVECDEGAAEIIKTIPARDLPALVKNMLYFLLFIGAATVVYFIMRMLTSI